MHPRQAAIINSDTQKRNNDENQANHDRAKLNGSTGDHSALDNAINQANSTPGLTVIRDADYQTTKNSDDYTGIGAWQDDTRGLYSRETDAINTAIAKQKQNNERVAQIFSDKAINNQSVAQRVNVLSTEFDRIQWNTNNTNYDVNVSGSGYRWAKINKDGSMDNGSSVAESNIGPDGSPFDKSFIKGDFPFYNSSNMTVIKGVNNNTRINIVWKNAATDKDTGRSLDLHVTLSNISPIRNTSQNPSWHNGQLQTYLYPQIGVLSNPADFLDTWSISYLEASPELTYSDNGQEYGKEYYWTVGSLDHNRADDPAEGTSAISGVKGVYVNNNSRINETPQAIHNATFSSSKWFTGEAQYPNGTHGYYKTTPSPSTGDDLNSKTDGAPNTFYYEGVTYKIANNARVALLLNEDSNTSTSSRGIPEYVHWMGNYTGGVAKPNTSEAHYHYNKLNVNSVPDISTTVHYHYDVSAGNCSCRTLLLQSSHSKFTKKEPHKRGSLLFILLF